MCMFVVSAGFNWSFQDFREFAKIKGKWWIWCSLVNLSTKDSQLSDSSLKFLAHIEQQGNISFIEVDAF